MASASEMAEMAALPCHRSRTLSSLGGETPGPRESAGPSRRSMSSIGEVRFEPLAPCDVAAELAELRQAYSKLRQAIRVRVHKSVSDDSIVAATAKKFAETSVGTIVGWMTAQTCHFAIFRWLGSPDVSHAVKSLSARLIYAALVSAVAPLISWSLRGVELHHTHFIADQVQLIRICLPMVFAWAWKDVVSASLQMAGDDLWLQLLGALFVTSILVAAESSPQYRRATDAVRGHGGRGGLRTNVMAMLGNLGLAVGFAWNSIFSWAPKRAFSAVGAPLFVFMVQVVYYVVVTSSIILIGLCLRGRGRRLAGREHLVEEDPESQGGGHDAERLVTHSVKSIADDIEKAGRSVTTSALHFVYAWAQLDTLNALFFTYLLGCDGPTTCGYQSNFYFAFVATFAFARAAAMLKMQRRLTRWNRHSAALMVKALSLNTGWAWANFCKTAIDEAATHVPIDPLRSYLLCTAFAWMGITFLHRSLEVELRAWDRHCRGEAESCELILR